MNLTREFVEAIERHLQLVDTLGVNHPDTMRTMVLAMELAPEELIDVFGDTLRKMGLMPEAEGYLEDGSPVFRLDDIAERLGASPEEAEEAMHKMVADREALGLSNAGIVTDAAMIYRKQ
jgi:hypothetical protein